MFINGGVISDIMTLHLSWAYSGSELSYDGKFTFRALLEYLNDQENDLGLAQSQKYLKGIGQALQTRSPDFASVPYLLKDYYFEGFADMLSLDMRARRNILESLLVKSLLARPNSVYGAGKELTFDNIDAVIAHICPGAELSEAQQTRLAFNQYNQQPRLSVESLASATGRMPPGPLRDHYMTKGAQTLIAQADNADILKTLRERFGYCATTEEAFPLLDRAVRKIMSDIQRQHLPYPKFTR